MTCKAFSQKDTLQVKTKYVFLTEAQARANIKELVAYDGLKKQYAIQEERIQNFKNILAQIRGVLIKKDSIILEQRGIIDIQDKIIKGSWKPKFTGYSGVDFIGLDLNNPTFYFRSAVELKKISVGVQLNGRLSDQYQLPNFYTTLRAEIQIF